jgi:hypothetical protein
MRGSILVDSYSVTITFDRLSKVGTVLSGIIREFTSQIYASRCPPFDLAIVPIPYLSSIP